MSGAQPAIATKLAPLLFSPLASIIERVFNNQEEENRLMDVFELLSKHEALDHMHHPGFSDKDRDKQWEALDLYRGNGNDVLSLTCYYASVGQKARIMMVLLWIIVRALDSHKDIAPTSVVNGAIFKKLRECDKNANISPYKAAVKRLLKLFNKKFPPDLAELIDVEAVENFDSISQQLLQQFRAKFPEQCRNEYSVYRRPSLIIQRTVPVIAPADKNTMRLFTWATDKLYMGNEVQEYAEVRDDLCWNVFLARGEDFSGGGAEDAPDGGRDGRATQGGGSEEVVEDLTLPLLSSARPAGGTQQGSVNEDYVGHASRKVLELHTNLRKRNNRQLIVYLALSVHPVLKNHLTCPAHPDDIPTSIITPGTFPESVQAIGRERIRIIVSLMSLIGQSIGKDLQDGKMLSFVSTAIADGLNEVQGTISPLRILGSVKDITLEFAQSIISAGDRLYVNADDEESIIPVSALRGDNTYRQYKYDVKESPSTLLRPLSAILIPKTKLTERLIRQLITEYHLGSQYPGPSDNEPYFWRVFLPPEYSDLTLAEGFRNAGDLRQVGNGSKKYPKLNLPTKLFALVIGINDYQHWTPLKGAVKDANDIEYFLINSLSVPPNHIKKLLNGDATRDRIIGELQAFSTNPNINKEHGDAILIYFAGHGCFCAPPEGWESRGNQIEMICPVDISREEAAEPRITGIPDIILNLLISQLAVDKGDNVTVIFDCCHSSSAIRHGVSARQSNIRGIDNPPPLTGNWDNDIMRTTGKATPDVYANSLDHAVLLAACGKGEKAGDSPQGGLFTQHLLKKIEGLESIDLVQLSYNGLMRNLTISEIQHPQCESSKSNRYLFRKETEHRSYIYGSKEDGKFVLDAGQLQGIKEGAEFDIFGKNSLTPDNTRRYRFRVAEVKKRISYLTSLTAPIPSDIPDHFYALQTSFAEEQKIRVYCSDYKRLNRLLLQRQADFAGFVTLVGKRGDAVVVVSFEGDCICFDWHEINIITKHARSRIGSPVPIEKKEKIIRIFQAVAKFNYYLNIEGADAQHIQLHLQRMVMKSHDIEGRSRPVRTPEGNNLLEQEPAAIEIEKDKVFGPLVLTISNSSKRDLHPHVFWFDGLTLAIDPWYIGQRGAGPKEAIADVDIPLPAGGKCPVGYGDVPVAPWEFLLEDGCPEVGFFKVFLATFNTNVSSFAQASPFDESEADRGVKMVKLTPVDWWATKKATILQRMKPFDTQNKIGAE